MSSGPAHASGVAAEDKVSDKLRDEPLFSIVVLSYNRSAYLREFLKSLLEQESSESYELILLDNGSDTDLAPRMQDLLVQLPGSVSLIREKHNHLSPARWKQAANLATGQFVLTPGDDDVLKPNYLSTMAALAQSESQITMLSGAVQVIDAKGRLVGKDISPAVFTSQAEALSRLIARDEYPMPGSGFRRDAVDLSEAPLTRTAFDWWLWIQCWMTGHAAVTQDSVVLYRQHDGQEQRHYGRQRFRTDAARMLMATLHSEQFRSVVDAWTQDDLEQFSSTLLQSTGPMYGDTRWGPLVQMALVDLLRERLPESVITDLYAQATSQAGTIVSVGDLQTLMASPMAQAQLPRMTWSRVPVVANWEATCDLATAWSDYLQLPTSGTREIVVEFQCRCATQPQEGHELDVVLRRRDTASTVRLRLAETPNDAAAAPLLEAVGVLRGRPHGFEVSTTAEAMVVSAVQRFRTSRPGVALEYLLWRVLVISRRLRRSQPQNRGFKP